VKPCVDCVEYAKLSGKPVPKRKTDGAARTPRCATHKRQRARASKATSHETRVRKVYGLQAGEYERLYVFQGQVCAICQRATGASRKLSVDHDHKTGLVRGLLCRPCNDLLGHLRDDRRAVMRLYQYLGEPPAYFLGIHALHEDFRKDE
jgi:hypothetical protein